MTEAWSRSFARHQREARGRKPDRGRGAKQIQARLALLRERNYIDERGLTRKGRLCAQVNGYEIAVTEAYERGWLLRCDPVQMAMLFAAMVYESRPHDASDRPTRSLKGIAVPFTMHMEAFAADEAAFGVDPTLRPPDFGMAGPVQAWAEGRDFEDVLARTSLAPGDVVRVLRMTIQMLRQVRHALDPSDPTVEVLYEAQQRIDRDVVDARRQLELG